MMPAAKHGDPQLGVDIHLCVVPPSPSPVPLPTPHMSVVFDPFDYVPIFGATVSVCGMKRATAGTSGTAVHIPPGFPFAPMLPQKDDELFMGSATVVADGDPFSFIALPVLSCQVAGMPSIPRLRKKGPKKMMLGPLVFNLAIPTNVFVGGPPTISIMGLAMKGAFSALGKFAKSGLFKRMRQKLFKNMNPGFLKCAILRAEPVNILSGAVSVEQEDFVLPGRIAIEWRRVYGSDNQRAGQCGYGWETPADGRLEINHEGVSLHYPGVGPLYFNGVPVAEGDAAAELEVQDGAVLTDADSEFQVRTKEDRIYHFPKSWLARTASGGATIALSKISDLCGNSLRFERSGGVLTGIQESAGRRIELTTDQGRILEIALSVPESLDRHVYVRYEYDAHGDLLAVRDALNHPYTFSYQAHQMERHTDRNGLSFHYQYDSANDDGRVVHAWGDGGLYDYRFEYSDVLKERRITDSLGHTSIVKLNPQGLPINEIDALGGVTIYEYDDAGRTVGITDQDGHRTGYEYDAFGNLVQLTRPDSTQVSTLWNSSGKPTSITDANGGQWEQTWDSRGLLVRRMSPLGHLSLYEYDAQGQLTAYADPRGARTELRFDSYGNLVRLTDPLGAPTRFGHDALGNVTGRMDAMSCRILYQYDSKSRLVQVRLPSGATLHYEYDAEDNLIGHVDENGTVTRMEYSGQGEVARRLQSDGHAIEYLYDSEERLIGVRNQRGELYSIDRDALGRMIRETDYHGQSHQYEYTAGGRVCVSIDPLQRRVTYRVDPMGRILEKVLPCHDDPARSFSETFTYDANGNLIAAENPHGCVVRTFDAEERLIEERQATGFIVRNSYDAAGNRITRQVSHQQGTWLEHSVQFEFDVGGQASEIRIDDAVPIKIERNAAGQIVTEQLAPGLRREAEYSADGHLTRQRVRAGAQHQFEVAYRYDPAGNLTERADSEFGIDRFIHDPLGRITDHIDPRGNLERWANDPVGDRWQTQWNGGRDPALGGTHAASHEAVHGDTRYCFDRAGNLIARHSAAGQLNLSWDANQRLVASTFNGVTTSYQYDPLGRRLHKSTADQVTSFAWDADVLIAEMCIAGQRCRGKEWVYFPDSFEPLAVLDAEAGPGATLFYHNDPNGCPSRLTTSKGETRWAASHTAWGDIASLHVADVAQPLALQGQYRDSETGLCYNRHRYFDPAVGAFISADPLHLSAGENLYDFGPNSFCWTDPLGLAKCRIPKKKLKYAMGYYKHNPASVGKGKLFREKGFGLSSLRSEVQRLFNEGKPSNIRFTDHGKQFSIVGEITSRTGETVRVATGWIVDHGSTIPRLVTISPN